MNLSTILDQIDLGSIALPEFQRGYVWSRDQVRRLMRSLYRGYPVGSLLTWETQTLNADARGDGQLAPGAVKLLLDDQQRVTSLYGIVRGEPPAFFDGDASRFLKLYFNLDSEEFEFFGPIKMKGDPLWINVTDLMQQGAGNFIGKVMQIPQLTQDADKLNLYVARLNRLANVHDRTFHLDNVTGKDKTVDVVVEIFNEVNSGGTKLSQGDLALAKICAAWPQARGEMQARLSKWEGAGFYFKLDWFLRCINAILTGEAVFTALDDVTVAEFQDGLQRAEALVDRILNLIADRLGLDHDRVLGSRYAIPLMTCYLDQGGGFADAQERDNLLFWYVHTMLWGRYSASTETTLRQDLVAIEDNENPLEALIDQLRQNRGDLRLYARDFEGATRGSRFYPMLYMMTRVWNARNFEIGTELKAHLLGKQSSLQLHHIFPKSKLYDHGYSKYMVNALANFTFLTQETNLEVSNRDPMEYFEFYEGKHPGILNSHWIPMDRDLWKYENYPRFLEARRELLAEAANDFLQQLGSGNIAETEGVASVLERPTESIPGRIEGAEEEEQLLACMAWLEEQGLPIGDLEFQLVNEADNQVVAVLDLAWEDGIQTGLSHPVALLIDEDEQTLDIAQRHGFTCFTAVEQLQEYVKRDILGVDGNLD